MKMTPESAEIASIVFYIQNEHMEIVHLASGNGVPHTDRDLHSSLTVGPGDVRLF